MTGNGLAVVGDADELDEATMLAFARETRLSETTFVQRPTAAGADYRNRIFDARMELPFAGHPSLGTAVAVARARGLEAGTLRQQTHPGVQPIDVERRGGELWTASMLQEPPTFGPELDAAEVLALVGLAAADAAPGLPPQVVGTGVPQVLAFVAEAGALDRAAPDFAAIEPFLDARGAIVLYVVHADGRRANARSFGHSADMGEDPATGSAAGPVSAYLRERAGTEEVVIAQGVAMGRPSVLRTRWEGDRPRVGGDVVVLAEGLVHLRSGRMF
jgi:trans-2,3-dihydro-3-hydroxyanthranilate isomerase